VLLAALLAALSQSGCGPDATRRADATEVPGAAATAARRAATAIPSPLRAPTDTPGVPTPRPRPSPSGGPSDEEQIAAVVRQIADVLDSGNLDGLAPLMLDQIAVAAGGDQGAETMDRDLAIAWLKDRAAPGPKVQSSDQVEFFGLVEVRTGPWETKPPVTSGTVVFNLHRVDDSGRQALSGAWKIDVLIPQ